MLPFLIQEFLKNVYLCPIVAFYKSYEVLIPRSKDQNILTIQNILAFSKSLSCSCNRCILLLAFVSLSLGNTANSWDLQSLLEEHRCVREALNPEVNVQSSHISCVSQLKNLLCKDSDYLGG